MLDKDQTVLECENISKKFGNTVALDDVSLDIKKGEVLAIVGENGAGKSTLASIISGIYKQDQGVIKLFGKELSKSNVTPALRQSMGINLVPQEINPFQSLSIAENIFINKQPTRKSGLINYKELFSRASNLLKSFGLNENSKTIVKGLELHKKQLIEILSKLVMESKILILDEPTSALAEGEVGILFKFITKLKEQDVSIIYVSHRLQEVFEISDRIMVLRDGKCVDISETKNTTTDEIIKQMVGKDLSNSYDIIRKGINILNKNKTPLLETKNYSGNNFIDVNIKLFRGEILSLAGLVGDGRKELGKTIFGILPKTSGELYLEGKKVFINSQKNAIDFSFGYMPEDRKDQGLFLRMSVRENLIAVNTREFSSLKWINRKSEIAKSKESVEALRIKTPGLSTPVESLSGGNQQKLLLAKWLQIKPKILIVDEPTRGVDIGAKNEIYKILKNIAKSGTGIILISLDLPEVLYLSHAIYVFKKGSIANYLINNGIDEKQILKFASLKEN